MSYNRKDMALLSEAYSLTLLKEQAPHMTLGQVQSRLHLMTESELQYITDVNERIINELFGGLKNLGTAVKNVGANAVQGVKNVGANVANATGSAVKGGLAAAGQVASNAANMYATGNQASAQTKSLQQASDSIKQLIDALTQAINAKLIPAMGDPMNLPLKNIVARLEKAQSTAGANADTASQGGFLKGAGQAASSAYNAARQPTATPTGQPQTA